MKQTPTDVLKQLQETDDLRACHEALRGLECSGALLDDTITAETPTEGRPQEQALRSFMLSYGSYCRGMAKEFTHAIAPLTGLTQPTGPIERYLAARGNCLLAMHCCRMGRVTDAAAHAALARAMGAGLNFAPLTVETLRVESLIRTAASDWVEGAERAGLALHLLQQDNAKDPLNEAGTWLALGMAYFGQSDFAVARRYMETALDFYNRCADYYGQAQAQLLLAHLYYHTADYERHDRVLYQVEPLCARFGFFRDQGKARRYRGKRELQRGDCDKAIACFRESLEIMAQLGDPSASALTHLSLARAYAVKREYDKALAEYGEAERGFAAGHDETHMATARAIKALLLAQAKPDTPRAEIEALFTDAVTIFTRLNDRRHLATTLYEMGIQCRRWQDYGAAVKYLSDAVRWASVMHADRLLERYRTEERLSEADLAWSEMLSTAVRQRETVLCILQNVTHDLNNVATAISASMGVMRHLQTIEQFRECATKAQSFADYMHALCNGLLKGQRPDAVKLDMKTIALCPLVEKAIGIVAPRAGTKELSIRNEVEPEVHVHADADELLRVLVNLIGNAEKFTPDGAITVSAAPLAKENRVRVTLRDTGYGMDPAMREHVFDLEKQGVRYVELEKTNPALSASRGFGIGLVFCATAIKRHGGRIWVDLDETRTKGEDEQDKDRHGTVIHFTVPAGGTRP